MIEVGMDFVDFIHLISLLLPSIFFLVLPLVLFISSILTYNKLLTSSEITILLSCGLSKYKLLRPALLVVGLFVLVNYLFAFYIMPTANREFKEKIQYFKEHRVAILIEEGIFLQPANNITFFVQQKLNDTLLKDIFIHDTRNPLKTTTLFAKSGQFIQKKNETLLYLENGNRQEINDKDDYSIIYFNKLEFDLELNKKTNNERSYSIGELYFHNLLLPPEGTDQMRSNKMLVEASNRIVWPIISIILVICAVNSIIGGEFNRFGKKIRIVKVGIFATILVAVIIGTNNLAANYISILLAQYLFLALSLFYWTKRVRS